MSISLYKANINARPLVWQQKRTQEQIAADINHTSGLVHMIVCGINDLATNELVDALGELQKTKYYRHDVKRAAKQAYASYKQYESINWADMKGKWDLYGDYLDNLAQGVEKDLNNLRFALDRVMRRRGETEIDLKVRIMTTVCLLQMSVKIFDDFFDTVRADVGFDLRQGFSAARLTSTLKWWEKVADVVCYTKDNVNLADDKDVNLAIKIICTKLYDSAFLEDNAKEAMLANNMEIKEDEEELNQNLEA